MNFMKRIVPFLLASTVLAAPSGDLRIELLLAGDTFIQGEPIRAAIRFECTGTGPIELPLSESSQLVVRARGASNFDICDTPGFRINPPGIGAQGHPDSHPTHQVASGDVWTPTPFDVLGSCHLQSAGTYELRVSQPFNQRPTPVEQQLAWTGLAQSEWITITILQPSGVNAEAFTAFAGSPLQEANKRKLIDDYPTSIYTGWALLNTDLGVSLAVADGATLLETFLLPYEKGGTLTDHLPPLPDGTPNPKTPAAKASKYAPIMEEFLAANPEASTAPIVRMKLGIHHAVQHRWSESYESLERSLADPWPAWYGTGDAIQKTRQLVKEMLEAIEGRGLVDSDPGPLTKGSSAQPRTIGN